MVPRRPPYTHDPHYWGFWLVATIIALVTGVVLAIVAAYSLDCLLKLTSVTDLAELCYAQTDIGNDPLTIEGRCACIFSGRAFEIGLMFWTATAFVLLALVTAWRGRGNRVVGLFAVCAAFTAYVCTIAVLKYVSIFWSTDNRLFGVLDRILDPENALATPGLALLIASLVCGPMALFQFTRLHPHALSMAELSRPLWRSILGPKLLTPLAGDISRAHLVLLWVVIAALVSLRLVSQRVDDSVLLTVPLTGALVLFHVWLENRNIRTHHPVLRAWATRGLQFGVSVFVLSALWLILARGLGHEEPWRAWLVVNIAGQTVGPVLLWTSAAHVRRTLAQTPALVLLPVLTSGLLLLWVGMPWTELIGAGAWVALLGILASMANLALGYRLATQSERRQASWMYLGFLVSSFLFLIGLIAELLSFRSWVANLWFFSLPLLSIFLAISVFYKGEIDPRLAIWRGTVYLLTGVGTAVVFGLVEHLISYYLTPFLPAPTVAAVVAAVAIKPLKDGCEHFVRFGVSRLLGN